MTHDRFYLNHLFHKLPEVLADRLFETGAVSAVPAGKVIMEEGEALDRLFIVLAGHVEVYLPEGAHRVAAVRLTVLKPGDCFGEYAFVDREPASASIRAMGDVEIYAIDFDLLQRFLDEHPTVAAIVYRNLLHILVKRLRDSNAELDLFSFS